MDKQETKKNAIEVPVPYTVNTIDQAVEYLQECKRKGQNVYLIFNGVSGKQKLYSCDVTIDSAYMQIEGMTKAESDELEEAFWDAKTPEEKQAVIARGEAIKEKHKQEALKQNAIEVPVPYTVNTIDQAVEYLQECKTKGQNIYLIFNGVSGKQKLYSCDVTIDSAYMQIEGMTKAESDELEEAFWDAKTPEEKQAVIARGEAIKEKHKKEAEFSTQQIGKATINTPTTAKKEAEQIENSEITRDNIKEGEEERDDN